MLPKAILIFDVPYEEEHEAKILKWELRLMIEAIAEN